MQKWFSVSQVSQLAGVSVRTLHHYDQIGLLTPLRRQDNGYRCYSEPHLAKLQQILLYRQLDFSLEQIRDMMQAADFDAVNALQQQHALLLSKLDATQQMINNIEVAMTIAQGKQNMQILFSTVPQDKAAQWQQDFANQFSEPGEYETALQAMGNVSAAQSQHLTEEFDNWVAQYLPLLALPVQAEAVQQLVLQHLAMQNRFLSQMMLDEAYQGLTGEIFLMLTEALIEDELAQQMYAYYNPALPEHLYEAMMYFTEHSFKPAPEQYRFIGVEKADSLS
ncbi:MerR family transcriptional regulator [Rheinheimera baltica]|uniref:MerR family transcriptional regulator n=1 Tax=Rheinheimera baltica TaxID=67576 RepID=UPI0004231F71|nr:MerR family transcriptional regulator [Rheinheimera baltica]